MHRRLLALVCTTASLAAQTTWIVEAGNPAALPTLAAAVGAAADGDTIVIRHTGEWIASTILINKALTIVGSTPGAANGVPHLSFFFGAGLQVQVAAGKELLLANVTLRGFGTSGTPSSSQVSIANCGGRVILQDLPASVFSLHVAQSTQVMLSRVEMTMTIPMVVDHATVACDRCTLIGRPADHEWSLPSVAALSLQNADVRCVDTAITGGNAAWHLASWVPSQPGTRALTAVASTLTMSGPSCSIASGVLATVPAIDSTQSVFVFPPTMLPAPTIAGTATVTSVDAPSVGVAGFAAGTTASFTVRSPSGSLSALAFGMPGDRLAIPGFLGELWLDPLTVRLPLVGIQNGSLTWTVAVPPSPALFGAAFRWQAVAVSGGQFVLGTPGAGMLR